MRVFVDNTFSRRTTQALNLIEDRFELTHLRDRWKDDPGDDIWIPEIGAEGNWVVFTEDRKILDHHYEIWRDARLPTIFFKHPWAQRKRIQLMQQMCARWERIHKLVRTLKPGEACKLPWQAQPVPLDLDKMDRVQARRRAKAAARALAAAAD